MKEAEKAEVSPDIQIEQSETTRDQAVVPITLSFSLNLSSLKRSHFNNHVKRYHFTQNITLK